VRERKHGAKKELQKEEEAAAAYSIGALREDWK